MPNPTRPLEIICSDPSECDVVVPVRERGPIPTLCPRHKHLKKLADIRAQYAAQSDQRGIVPPQPKTKGPKAESNAARLTLLEMALADEVARRKRLGEALENLRASYNNNMKIIAEKLGLGAPA